MTERICQKWGDFMLGRIDTSFLDSELKLYLLTLTLNIISWKLYVWVLWDHYHSFEMVHSLEECLKRRIFLKRLISCQSFSIKHPWFEFIGQFSNYVVFDEIKWLCTFAKYTTLKFITKLSTPISWNLTPFSPFGIKSKKLDEKIYV